MGSLCLGKLTWWSIKKSITSLKIEKKNKEEKTYSWRHYVRSRKGRNHLWKIVNPFRYHKETFSDTDVRLLRGQQSQSSITCSSESLLMVLEVWATFAILETEPKAFNLVCRSHAFDLRIMAMKYKQTTSPQPLAGLLFIYLFSAWTLEAWLSQ